MGFPALLQGRAAQWQEGGAFGERLWSPWREADFVPVLFFQQRENMIVKLICESCETM